MVVVWVDDWVVQLVGDWAVWSAVGLAVGLAAHLVDD